MKIIQKEKKQTSVSIVIVNYNKKSILRECLNSIFHLNNDVFSSARIHVIVIDNGSKDGSAEMVIRLFPQVNLIRNKKNIGYTSAINQGARASDRASDLLFLNSDTIAPKKSLARFIDFMRLHPNCLGGPRIIDGNNHWQFSAYETPSLLKSLLGICIGEKTHRLGFVTKFPWFQKNTKDIEKVSAATQIISMKVKKSTQHSEIIKVGWLTGAVLYVPREIIETVGLFAEKYFFYGEDMDYGDRVRAAHFDVFYIPSITFQHIGAASSLGEMRKKTTEWYHKSLWLYWGRVQMYILLVVVKIVTFIQKMLSFAFKT